MTGEAKGRTAGQNDRHYNMSRIRGKDTKPEMMVRRYLFSMGLRFRKNDPRYPGHPDVVLPRYRTVIFVNGCFWHGHEGCRYHSIPRTNTEFWEAKVRRNRERDWDQYAQLISMGWRVMVIWECELRPGCREERLRQLYDEIVS